MDDENDADHREDWNIIRDKGELSESAEEATPYSPVLREVIKDALWLRQLQR